MKKNKHQQGFTLIELLIVIAIIGILAGLIGANFVTVRQRARDADRKTDIEQTRTALELYRTDQGTYPAPVSGNIVGTCGGALSVGSVTYLQKIPCDPTGAGYNSGGYLYTTGGGGTSYTLSACLENGNDTGQNVTSTAPSGGSGTCSSGKYYTTVNP